MFKRPECPTCNQKLSVGAAVNGKSKFFCININCPNRFKTIDDPEMIKPDG